MPRVTFMLAALVAVLVVLVAVGCDDSGPADADVKTGTKNYKAIVITYDGRPLRCVERGGSTGLDTTSGAYSGLSCDWVAYHENG